VYSGASKPSDERQGTGLLPGDEVRFDGWTLRRSTGELARDGASVRLQSQPLLILELLLAEPGELVTRERLIARLWPGGVVDFDTALNSAVRRLRTALGDHPEHPRYIETIPRRGYRFIGRLDSPPGAAATAAAPAGQEARGWRRSTRWLATAGVLLAVVAAGAFTWAEREPAAGAADPQARELYERAQLFLQRRDRSDIELARRYFDEAVALDPEFAEAWVGVASAYMHSVFENLLPAEQALARARHAAERALELDPTLTMAHLRLANYWGLSGNRERAMEHIRAARELRPDDPVALVMEAGLLTEHGRFDEAAKWQRRAVEQDPLTFSTRYNLAFNLFMAGRVAEAEVELNRLRELHPGRRAPMELHGVLLLTTGRYAEALALASGWDESFDREFICAVALDGLGRREEADAVLRRMIEQHGTIEGFRIAEVYAHRGDVDAAFRWLESGIASERADGWRANDRRPLWLLDDWPLLRTARQDPRWAHWYAAALQPQAQANAG
jgi:DNA-binding winged helix-turn-helix (wHTH) protein/Tfp pilus assembly protein PilF